MRSASRHIDKSHLVSSGVGAANPPGAIARKGVFTRGGEKANSHRIARTAMIDISPAGRSFVRVLGIEVNKPRRAGQ